MFDKKGVIAVTKGDINEEELMDQIIEAEADDLDSSNPEVFIVFSAPASVHKVAENLKSQGIEYNSAEITYIPQNTIKVEGKEAIRVLKLMDKIEEQDDVQEVVANFDIDEATIEEFHNS